MTTPPFPALPTGQRLYAVGDVHGCADLLARLMAKIVADAALYPAAQKELVFLGDYVDRGVDTRGTLDFLLYRLPPDMKTVFLRGNHEEVMLRFLDGDLGQAEGWLQFGGAATLVSYGVNPYGKGMNRNFAALRDALREKIPQAHRDFLAATQFDCLRGDYYFVHAGIRPHVPLAQQSEADRLWIRQDFLQSPADHGKIVVHGHSVAPQPDIQANRIGIDTGAYATGRLTCLVLDGMERLFIAT